MCAASKVEYVSVHQLPSVRAELARNGFWLYSLGAPSDLANLIAIMRDELPLNPPISGEVHLDALSDSLVGGLEYGGPTRLAIVVDNANCIARSSPAAFADTVDSIVTAFNHIEMAYRSRAEIPPAMRLVIGTDVGPSDSRE